MAMIVDSLASSFRRMRKRVPMALVVVPVFYATLHGLKAPESKA